MAAVKQTARNSLRECLESISLDPATVNTYSALSRAFVKCYLDSKASDYVSQFSRFMTEKLMDAYSCSTLLAKGVFQRISSRLDEIATALANRYAVYDLRLVTRSRLLVHTRGGQLPFEISLAWDTVFNVPFIPSTSIKGAARAYFEEHVGSIMGYTVDRLFGSEDSEGLIRFTDAYPVACKERLVEPEVVTPHYSEIEGRIDEASSKPVPIVFLAVSRGVTFRLIIAVKKQPAPMPDDIIKKVAEALSRGVGAKTMLGYGLFTTMITHKT